MDVRPAIELHIGELVLHGFTPADRHRIGDAVERELARLLGDEGVAGLDNDLQIHRLDGGRMATPPDAGGAALGAEIARAVHGALKGALGPAGRDGSGDA